MRRVLGLWWLLAGSLLVIGGALADYDASPSLSRMPDPWPAIVGLPLLVGGALCLAGTFKLSMLSTSWALMRAGAVLCWAGWLCYGVAVVLQSPGSAIAWLGGLTQSGLAGAWWLSVTREARTVRKIVAEGDH